MPNNNQTPRHPIRVVAQRTGLTPATIRAWERRYAAVQPSRSEGGQRLYSDNDVERLGTLRRLTEVGRGISMVAELSDEAAQALLEEDRAVANEPPVPTRTLEPSGWVDRAYVQVRALDSEGLEHTLWRSVMSLGAKAFLDDIVSPLLARIGSGWVEGEITPGQEHLASEVVDRLLSRLADTSRTSGGPGLVVATLPGEPHRLGARLAATAATLDGWNVTYLGADLPAEDISATAESVGASAVAISMVWRDDPARTLRSLIDLRKLLDTGIDVLVGGAGAAHMDPAHLPEGVIVLDGLEGLRDYRPTRRSVRRTS